MTNSTVTITEGSSRTLLGTLRYWEATSDGFEIAVERPNQEMVMLRIALPLERRKAFITELQAANEEDERAGKQ